jgi:hypothetical protein
VTLDTRNEPGNKNELFDFRNNFGYTQVGLASLQNFKSVSEIAMLQQFERTRSRRKSL